MYYRINTQNPRSEEFILYVDFESAYNTINLQLLFKHLSKLDIPHFNHEDRTFLFCLISKLNIHLGESSFRPQFGVPQGGLTSPILFNYAMYFIIHMIMEAINSKLSGSCISLRTLRKQSLSGYNFQHNDVFIWANDLAIRFSTIYWQETKFMLKCILECVMSECKKWGLKINFRKSALQIFHTRRTNFSEISDSSTDWDNNNKKKECLITLKILSLNEIVELPCVDV